MRDLSKIQRVILRTKEGNFIASDYPAHTIVPLAPTLSLCSGDRPAPYLGRHEKHQCIYWDKALPGFGLRVYASGRRGYVCSYRIHRRKRLAVLGRADLLTLERARKLAVTFARRRTFFGIGAANSPVGGECAAARRSVVASPSLL